MKEKITKTVWRCVCELPDCRGKGKPWNSIDHLVPERCRWCGRHTWDGKDKRPKRMVTAHGKTMCISQWAKETGIDKSTIRMRLSLEWSDEDAVTAPVGTLRKARKTK